MGRSLEEMRGDLDSERGKTRKAEATLAKIGSIFTGDDGKPKKPALNEEIGEFTDEVLSIALEAEKEGKSIPLTTKSALYIKQLADQNAQLSQQIAELTGQVKKQSDPATGLDMQAYHQMDTMIDNGVIRLFGDHNPSYSKMVADTLQPVIEKMQRENPKQWDYARRNPNVMGKMVNEAIAKVIPPQARKVMEEEHIRKTDMSADQLMQAFYEAKEHIKDPEQRRKVCEGIRQELLVAQYMKGGKLRY